MANAFFLIFVLIYGKKFSRPKMVFSGLVLVSSCLLLLTAIGNNIESGEQELINKLVLLSFLVLGASLLNLVDYIRKDRIRWGNLLLYLPILPIIFFDLNGIADAFDLVYFSVSLVCASIIIPSRPLLKMHFFDKILLKGVLIILFFVNLINFGGQPLLVSFLVLIVVSIYLFLLLHIAFKITPAGKVIPQKPIKTEFKDINRKEFQLLKKIDDLFRYDKVYTDQKMSLDKLSQRLECKSYLVSSTINKFHGQSFKEFLNRNRIDHVIKLLEELRFKDTTIEGLAYEAGYSSPSTFYVAFKKVTGKTTQEFIDQLDCCMADKMRYSLS